jgi:hypothetical protein
VRVFTQLCNNNLDILAGARSRRWRRRGGRWGEELDKLKWAICTCASICLPFRCTAGRSCPRSERFKLLIHQPGGGCDQKDWRKTLQCRRRRERLQKKEAELQGAKSDRANAQMEKAALERQVKQVQSQTGRMTKDLEKKVRSIVPRV